MEAMAFLFLFYFILFFLFRVTPVFCHASGPIRAVAASLCHSHSNVRSELHLQPTTAACHNAGSLTQLNEARHQILILMDTSRVLNLLRHMGTPMAFL